MYNTNGEILPIAFHNNHNEWINKYVNAEILFLYMYYFTIRIYVIDLVHKMVCMIHQTISFLISYTDKAFKTMIIWETICMLILKSNCYNFTFYTIKCFLLFVCFIDLDHKQIIICPVHHMVWLQ